MSDVRDPDRDQQLPKSNAHTAIQKLVMDDLQERMEHGIRKYGMALQPLDGRNMMLDLYEELLDACVYVKGVLEEQRIESEKIHEILNDSMSEMQTSALPIWSEAPCFCYKPKPIAAGYAFYICSFCNGNISEAKMVLIK